MATTVCLSVSRVISEPFSRTESSTGKTWVSSNGITVLVSYPGICNKSNNKSWLRYREQPRPPSPRLGTHKASHICLHSYRQTPPPKPYHTRATPQPPVTAPPTDFSSSPLSSSPQAPSHRPHPSPPLSPSSSSSSPSHHP